MKQVGIIVMSLLISHSVYSNDTAKNCRDYYYGVCLDQIAIQDFHDYLELHHSNEDNIIKGYEAVIWFLWADYYINPMQKWKCFKKGKAQLDALIEANKKSMELRFLRLTIQENVPSFLGYNQNKKEDKSFIHSQLGRVSDKDLHKRIVNYLCYNSMTKIN